MSKISKDKLQITGYSDDIVSLDGSIYDEISVYDEEVYLILPDKSKIWVYYDENGIWRVAPLVKPVVPFTLEKGSVENDTNDVLTIEHPFQYIIWQIEGKQGVVGEISLDSIEQHRFQLIQGVLDGSDFDEQENTIKAILAGLLD